MNFLWDDTARELREVVKRAHAEYLRASEVSKAIVMETPSGLPHPDGAQRVTNAAQAERYALDTYVKALQAFNDYVNRKKPL